MTHTSQRTSAWTTLLVSLALTPILGGGCTAVYSSGDHDDDDDDDENVIIVENQSDDPAAGSGSVTDAPTAAELEGQGAPAAGTPPALPGVTTLWNSDGLVVLLSEVPDSDGDGVPELGVLLIGALPADSGRAGEITLAADAFLLSGGDGRVLQQRSNDERQQRHASVSVMPLHATR